MATFQELLAQKEALQRQQEALEKQIAEQLSTQRAEALQKIREIMAEFGLTVEDLSAKSASKPSRKTKAASDETRKVAAKYRDSASGQSWSGRGLQPRWLKAALAEGKKLEDFAV